MASPATPAKDGSEREKRKEGSWRHREGRLVARAGAKARRGGTKRSGRYLSLSARLRRSGSVFRLATRMQLQQQQQQQQQQPQPSRRPRRAASLLLLPLLPMVLFAPSAAAAAPSAPKFVWKDHGGPLASRGAALDAPGLQQVAGVAQTAVHYLNYRLGSPSSLRAPGQVKKASVKTIPGVGRKYFLQFSTKDLQTGQNLGTCLASVFYLKNKPKPMVEISCFQSKDPDQRLQEDYGLYLSIRDGSGPSFHHLSALASAGSSYIAWEKSSEGMTYVMTQVKNAQQWRRADESLEFDFSVLLGSSRSETLSCHMRVVWKLDQPLKVKYDCITEDGSAESADGSGAEMGSTSGFFTDPEFNF